MATSVLAATSQSPFRWVRQFLRDELAPYPGRIVRVSRMVLTATVVMLIVMTFKIPYGAFAALYSLLISRESPEATLNAVKWTLMAYAASFAYVLFLSVLLSGDPLPRLVGVLGSLFLIFYVLSAAENHTAGSQFGYLVVITIPLGDSRLTGEEKITSVLWAVGAIAIGLIVSAAVELIYAGLYKLDDVTAALLDRLRSTAAALRGWSSGNADRTAEQSLARLTIVGTSRMRRDLLRSGYGMETKQEMGAVVSLVGRLIDLAANLVLFSAQAAEEDRRRFGQLADRIDSLAQQLAAKGTRQEPISRADHADVATQIPLLIQMESTVSLISDVLSGSDVHGVPGPPVETAEPRMRILAADAFTNPDHIRFAIRGSLSAAVCYVIYNSIDWREISTAVVTCFITAQTTVGASRQKQILRIGGALAGGLIGLIAQMFVLPALDSIAGFMMLFLVVTAVGVWILTSSPRLSYFGAQLALAFYLINLQEFRFQTSLAVARDRVVGILLGLAAMWLIFDHLWGAPAILEMKRTFITTLRLMSDLMKEPLSSDKHVAIERSYSLRETIDSNFNNLRQQGDGVKLEFGSSREQDLALRSTMAQWQLQLRIIFIARIALLKYRVRLPGFELPDPVLQAQQAFDTALAQRMDNLADHLQGKAASQPQNLSPLPVLETSVQEYSLKEPSASVVARLHSFLSLCARIDSLLTALATEIEAAPLG